MNFENLIVKEENDVVTVTINRPEALNALNESVVKNLDAVLASFAGQGIRAMILTGAGEKAFVAGADIKQFESMTSDTAVAFARRGQALFARFEALPFPVIAAVNGFALGGGLELALACDFIYASENAKFALPECTLGIMPGFGGTVRLPRRIGAGKAREMAYTGAQITAADALACGLVNKVVPLADLLAVATETAKVCGSRAPLALAHIKSAIRQGMNTTDDQASELEARYFGELFASEDQREGVAAFLQKRKPSFKGK